MNRALAALAARPILRGLIIALAVSLETILLVEAVRQLSQGRRSSPLRRCIAIAVVASFAGTRFGLLSAFFFIVYGAFIYAERQPAADLSRATACSSSSCSPELRSGLALIVGYLKARADQKKAHRTRA